MSDTTPAPDHGWLEQFKEFGHVAFEEIKTIVENGLTAAERVVMLKAGIKLIAYSLHNAKEEDFTEEMKTEIEDMVSELEKTLNIVKF